MTAVRRWGVLSGLLAPLLLVGGWTAAAALRPDAYDAVRRTISELAALGAPHRWLMTYALRRRRRCVTAPPRRRCGRPPCPVASCWRSAAWPPSSWPPTPCRPAAARRPRTPRRPRWRSAPWPAGRRSPGAAGRRTPAVLRLGPSLAAAAVLLARGALVRRGAVRRGRARRAGRALRRRPAGPVAAGRRPGPAPEGPGSGRPDRRPRPRHTVLPGTTSLPVERRRRSFRGTSADVGPGQAMSAAAARPAARPEKRQPPRNVPSSER